MKKMPLLEGWPWSRLSQAGSCIGLFFVPALVVLAVGGAKLWRAQS
jgi:hypothetical protein